MPRLTRKSSIRRIDIAVWLAALVWAAFGFFGPVA